MQIHLLAPAQLQRLPSGEEIVSESRIVFLNKKETRKKVDGQHDSVINLERDSFGALKQQCLKFGPNIEPKIAAILNTSL